MFICLIKNGRQTQKLDRGLQTSNSALRRRAKEGNLCGARYNILVVLFWLNKADLDVVFSYSFRSNAFLLGKKKRISWMHLKHFPSLTKVSAYLLKLAAQ